MKLLTIRLLYVVVGGAAALAVASLSSATSQTVHHATGQVRCSSEREYITLDINGGDAPYTVPAGKALLLTGGVQRGFDDRLQLLVNVADTGEVRTLFVMAASGEDTGTDLHGVLLEEGDIILPNGGTGHGTINGYLIDQVAVVCGEKREFLALVWDEEYPYVVPEGKSFIITAFSSSNRGYRSELRVDGNFQAVGIPSGSSVFRTYGLVVREGSTVAGQSNNISIFGYLVEH